MSFDAGPAVFIYLPVINSYKRIPSGIKVTSNELDPFALAFLSDRVMDCEQLADD